MEPEQQEKSDNLIKRLREEIISMFDKIISNDNIVFSNPHIVECQKTLDCKAKECHLYDSSSKPVRCWQIANTY
jgi:hypothetical protein